MAAFQEQAPNLVHEGCALSHKLVTDPMERLHVELLFGLQLDESHRWSRRRLRDRLGIAVIVLLRFDIGSYVFRRHQSNCVTLSSEGSPHMMASTTSLHRDDADGELGAEGDHRLTPHAASDQSPSDQIKANKA